MIDKQEFNGYWNFPGSNHQVPGILKYDPQEESIIQLLGHLSDENSFNILKKEDIIHGFTVNGKRITLFNCINKGTSMSFPGIPTISYQPFYIIIGAHLEDSTEKIFHEIVVEIELLTKWIDIWGFSFDRVESNNHFNIKYNLPDDINFTISDTVRGSFSFSGSSARNYEEEFTSVHKANLKITSSIELSLSAILELAWHFKKFLTIATQCGTHFRSIQLRSNKFTNEYDSKVFPKDLELLYHQRGINLDIKSQNSRYFLFTYEDIKDDFQNVIWNWYEKKEIMQPIIDTAYESLSNAMSFIENEFLSSIQALEVFHRRLRQNTEERKAQHAVVWKGILEKLSSEQATYINKFEYAYEPGLSQRLKDLIKEFKISTINKILGNSKQTANFVFKIVTSRNFYTHYDLGLKDQALKGADLFYNTERLKAILLAAILKEIGFETQAIEKMLAKIEHYKYQFILRS